MNRLQLWLVCISFAFSAPSYALLVQAMDGSRANVHDYIGHGRWTLVFLWSTECAPCEAQKPMIEAFYQQNRDDRAQVIGVALDGPAAQSAINTVIDRTKPSYTNFIAFDDVFEKQFLEETGRTLIVTPTYLLCRPDGSYAGAHTGPIKQATLERVISSSVNKTNR